MTANRDNLQKPKIGLMLFLTDRLRAIGEGEPGGTYAVVAEAYAKSVVEELGTDIEWVFPGFICNREELANAMARFVTERTDGVVAIHLSWTEDFNWIRFLRDMPPCPVMLACVVRDQLNFDVVSMGDGTFTQAMAACNVVGILEASGSIERMGRPNVEVCAGTAGQLRSRIGEWALAARAAARLRSSTMGLLGGYNEVMWSTYVDPYDVFSRIGPEIRFLGLNGLLEQMDNVDDGQVKLACDKALRDFRASMPIDREKLEASMRASMGFELLGAQYNLDLMVYNDVDAFMLRGLGLRPGFLRMYDGHMITVPEGDIGSGVAAFVLHALTGRAVHYIEPFFIDRERQCLVAGHSGPSNYDQGEGKCLLCNDLRFASADIRYPAAPMAWYVFPAGRYTLLHFSQGKGRYKMVTGQVDVLDSEHFYASYHHGRIRPVSMDAQRFVEKLTEIQVTQHFCLAAGDCRQQIRYLAKMQGFELFEL